MGVGKILQQRSGCCRCHGCAHVVDILDVIVLHPPKGGGGNAHPLPCRTQQAAPGGGSRPLGGRGAHRAVTQWGAELTLCRAEMTGSHGQQVLRRPAAAQRRAQRQRLRHGAARPEQPRKGHAQFPQRVAGGGALRLQISRQRKVHLLCGQASLLQAEPRRPQLQLLFGGFPAALSQPIVGGQFVKARCQRALALFFAARRRLCGDDRRGMEQQGIAPALCHKKFLLFCKKCPGTCYTGAVALQYPAGLFRIIRQKPPAATAPHRTPPPPACRTR